MARNSTSKPARRSARLSNMTSIPQIQPTPPHQPTPPSRTSPINVINTADWELTNWEEYGGLNDDEETEEEEEEEVEEVEDRMPHMDEQIAVDTGGDHDTVSLGTRYLLLEADVKQVVEDNNASPLPMSAKDIRLVSTLGHDQYTTLMDEDNLFPSSLDVDKWEVAMSPDIYLARYGQSSIMGLVQLSAHAPQRQPTIANDFNPGHWILLATSVHQIWARSTIKNALGVTG